MVISFFPTPPSGKALISFSALACPAASLADALLDRRSQHLRGLLPVCFLGHQRLNSIQEASHLNENNREKNLSKTNGTPSYALLSSRFRLRQNHLHMGFVEVDHVGLNVATATLPHSDRLAHISHNSGSSRAKVLLKKVAFIFRYLRVVSFPIDLHWTLLQTTTLPLSFGLPGLPARHLQNTF
ncbi:hypothetical protein TNCV_4920971 [Trichonephila clavipes]|nr:hypothetical protein TNCV_4920971 [Trichonephila clavipes]